MRQKGLFWISVLRVLRNSYTRQNVGNEDNGLSGSARWSAGPFHARVWAPALVLLHTVARLSQNNSCKFAL